MDELGLALILEFDRSERLFALGVEVGRLWEMAKHIPEEFDQEVHAENAEMVLRIADALGRPVSSEDLDENWLRVTFAERLENPEEAYGDH